MSPCPTRNSNQEEGLPVNIIVDAPSTSSGTIETLAKPMPLVLHPSNSYDVLPDLAQAFNQLTDSLTSSKKYSIQAQVRELNQFDSSDTYKL